MSREDVFKMMTQEEHDDYTRELEDKIVFLIESLMNYNSMTSEDIDNLLLDVQKIGRPE
jgi:Mg2+ and Co2+ transporter CorA